MIVNGILGGMRAQLIYLGAEIWILEIDRNIYHEFIGLMMDYLRFNGDEESNKFRQAHVFRVSRLLSVAVAAERSASRKLCAISSFRRRCCKVRYF